MFGVVFAPCLPRHTTTTKKLTNGLDDSLLQLPLLMSFDDLGTYVGAAIIGTSQLIVDTQSKLTQQGVEHLQYCGTCGHKQ